MRKWNGVLFILLTIVGCGNKVEAKLPEPVTIASGYEEVVKAGSWTIEITLSVVASPKKSDAEQGLTWEHQIEVVSDFIGTLTPYPDGVYTPATRIWKLTTGWVYGKINHETFSMGGGERTRSTLIGTKDFDIKDIIKNTWGQDSVIVNFSNQKSFTIFVPEISIPAYSTTYEANKPGVIWEGPTENTHLISGVKIENLPYSPKGTTQTGNKKVKKMIFGATGDGMELDMNVTWELKRAEVLAPLKPLGPKRLK